MGKSNSRKKRDRAKAIGRRAEQERLHAKAARMRQSAERYDQLSDPSASPADVAEILAVEFQDRVAAADMMRLRMSLGVPAEEITQTARLLLERAGQEPPGVGAGAGRVRVQVNSQHRLKRLLRILKEIGAAPKVAEESRSEPSLDFSWGPVPGHGLTARQWAENWLGQTVAVLGFHTPRHAAEGSQADRLRLEGLLRQLEYQSALPAEHGGRPIDTAWLRTELGLESYSSTPVPTADTTPASSCPGTCGSTTSS